MVQSNCPATLDVQATAQPGCEETLPSQLLRDPSLSVAILAINLGLLVSPDKKEK
jgi:hypothetical protein